MTESEEVLSMFEPEVAAAPVVTDDQIRSISRLAAEQNQLEADIARREENLQKVKDRLTEVSTKLLPDAMTAAGVKQFTLLDGSVVSVEPRIHAGISEPNEAEAFDWLEANNHGSIIKQTVSIDFPRAKNKAADADRQQKLDDLRKVLAEKGLAFAVKKGVHHSTLKAFVAEQLRSNADIPTKPFGIFQETVAKVTPKK
jgi:hypothetical protein